MQGSSGPLEYIVGVFYSDTDKAEYVPVIVGAELDPPVADIAYNYTVGDESKAVFAQLSYALTEKLTLTAGGRYTWEKLSLRQDPGSLFNLDGTTPFNQEADLEDPSWTFNVQYQINPDHMVYAAQRGSFRAGGFNGAVAPFDDVNFFDNENAYDFELGYKFNGILGNVPTRVNFAAYHQTVKDAQHSIFADLGGGPSAFTVNVPKKRIQGVELDAHFTATDWLEFGFAGAYTDAEFTENIVDLGPLGGPVIPFDTYADAPEWAGSVFAELSMALEGNAGDVKFRTDVFGQTSTYFSNNEGSITPRTQLPGYVTVDMRLSWNEIMGNQVSAAVYVKNLFDEFYYNSGYVEGGSGGFNTAIWGEPQTFGAELSYRF